jgi:predicted nucleotidyltransferase
MILFGSQARVDAAPHSDFDIMVIASFVPSISPSISCLPATKSFSIGG